MSEFRYIKIIVQWNFHYVAISVTSELWCIKIPLHCNFIMLLGFHYLNPVILLPFVPRSCSCQNHCFICNFTGFNFWFSYRSYNNGFLNIYCISGSTLHVFRITHLCFIGLSWLNPLLSLINWIFIGIIPHQLDFYWNYQHVYTLFGFISTNGYNISALYTLLVIYTHYWMTFWIWHYWISVAPTLSLFVPYPWR